MDNFNLAWCVCVVRVWCVCAWCGVCVWCECAMFVCGMWCVWGVWYVSAGVCVCGVVCVV